MFSGVSASEMRPGLEASIMATSFA